jgi:D-serine deaminase-like pyridoxal phosphate-dependent protein
MAASIIDQAHERVRETYRAQIGRPRDELVTPALILDLEVMRRNLAFMRDRMATMPTNLRAHVKVHKSPHIARMQVEYGAIGVGCATIWEAIVQSRAGIPDVFVINQLVGREKTRAAALLAREAPLRVAADDVVQADGISAAAVEAGSTIGVLVEVDTGMHRCGTESMTETLAVARRVAELPGLEFQGITGYEGALVVDEPDPVRRAEASRGARDYFSATADLLARNGLPCQIITAAGTANWEFDAADPRLTEIQPGSYATMDGLHKGLEPRFEQAATVLSTCVSVRSNRFVIDAGGKTVGGPGGRIRGSALPPGRFEEEHGIFVRDDDAALPIAVGDRVELLCTYTPFAVGYFEAYHVVENDRVIDVWPVMPRGPESRWLLDMLERGE